METKYGPEMMWSFNGNNNNPATNPKIWSGIYGWGDNSADIWWVDNVYPEQPRKYAYVEILDHDGVRFSDLPNKVPGIQKYLYDSWEDFQKGRSDRKSTRLNSSHVKISYAVFRWKNKQTTVERGTG